MVCTPCGMTATDTGGSDEMDWMGKWKCEDECRKRKSHIHLTTCNISRQKAPLCFDPYAVWDYKYTNRDLTRRVLGRAVGMSVWITSVTEASALHSPFGTDTVPLTKSIIRRITTSDKDGKVIDDSSVAVHGKIYTWCKSLPENFDTIEGTTGIAITVRYLFSERLNNQQLSLDDVLDIERLAHAQVKTGRNRPMQT